MTIIRVLAEVSADVAEAAEWYDEKGYVGLGERFEQAFYAQLEYLSAVAPLHPPVFSEFRRIYVKPFPYALYYRLYEDVAVVVLVIHAARNPQRVQRLLKRRDP